MKNMTRLIAVSFVVIISSLSYGQVPALINYQGRLLDGTNLVSGIYSIAFSIFTNTAGGSSYYQCSNTIEVVDGLYSTYIGEYPVSGTLTNALKYQPLYLEITIDGTTLSPRERLVAVLFSHVANGVVDDAITTDMLGYQCVNADKIADETITIDQLQDDSVDGNKIQNGSIEADDLSSTVSTVYVARAGSTMTGRLVLPQNGLLAGVGQLVLSNGNVGIGYDDPQAVLHVRGAGDSVRIDNYEETEAGLYMADWHTPNSQFAKLMYDSGAEVFNVYVNNPSNAVINISTNQRMTLGGEMAIGGSQPHTVYYTNQTIRYGDAAGWQPNTSGVHRGYAGTFIQDISVLSDSSGIYMDPDVMVLWSPGDLDLLRVYDEDDLNDPNPEPKFAVTGSGGIETESDLMVKGAFKGDIGNGGAPFPRPAYDSGWVDQPLSSANNYTHNLGGTLDDYIIDIQSKTYDGAITYPSGNTFYEQSDGSRHGYIINVTTNYWRIMNFEAGLSSQTNFRCRIWMVE